MTDFLILLVVGSFWCWGVFTLFYDGYVLDKIGDLLRKENDDSPPKIKGTWYSKPLFDCPPCMASIHGFLISAIYYDWLIYLMGAYMICLCGLNFIVKSILFPEYE